MICFSYLFLLEVLTVPVLWAASIKVESGGVVENWDKRNLWGQGVPGDRAGQRMHIRTKGEALTPGLNA